MPADHRSIVAPVVPAMTSCLLMKAAITLNVSGWTSESASMNARTAPRATAAPALRTAPMRRTADEATR